jgi:AraC family transcriptional regulator
MPATPPRAGRAVSVACPAMRVSHIGGSAEKRHDRFGQSIDILIPAENARLMAATYSTPAGLQRTTFVRAPLIAVLRPQQPCSVRSQHPLDMIVLSVEPSFYAQEVRALPGRHELELLEPHAAVDPFIRQVGNALYQDLQQQRPPSARYLQSLACVVAVHLARHYRKAEPPAAQSTGLASQKVDKVQAFIEANINKPLPVEALASQVNLSPFHFARTFKQATGQAPHLYVLMQRVERAKVLLRDTDRSVLDVALSTGFRTQGHFSGVFHRYTGFTPRAFRLSRVKN